MESENIIPIIDKLVEAKVTIAELLQIAPLFETADFQETFQLVESIEDAVKPIGRKELREEIKKASVDYHKGMQVIKLKKINRWSLLAVAASVLIICSTFIFNSLTSYNSYNDVKHFRKTYIENLK